MSIYGDKKFLRNVALSVFMAVSLESAVVGTHLFGADDAKTMPAGEYQRKYVRKVLKENRTGLSRGEETRLARFIIEQSREYGLDPIFVLALIETESTYYNWARSDRGALGLMQVVPSTGYSLAEELNIAWDGDETLYDPYKNVRMGLYYYASLRDRYGNNDRRALAAYNSGPTYVSTRLRRGEALSGRYGDKVFGKYRSHKERAVF